MYYVDSWNRFEGAAEREAKNTGPSINRSICYQLSVCEGLFTARESLCSAWGLWLVWATTHQGRIQLGSSSACGLETMEGFVKIIFHSLSICKQWECSVDLFSAHLFANSNITQIFLFYYYYFSICSWLLTIIFDRWISLEANSVAVTFIPLCIACLDGLMVNMSSLISRVQRWNMFLPSSMTSNWSLIQKSSGGLTSIMCTEYLLLHRHYAYMRFFG